MLREDQYPGKAVEQQDILLAHTIASPNFLETINKLLKQAIKYVKTGHYHITITISL